MGVITLIRLATAQAEMLFGCYGVQPKTNCHTLFVLIQCDRLLFHTTSKSVRILIKYSKQTAHHKHDSCIKMNRLLDSIATPLVKFSQEISPSRRLYYKTM